MKITGKTIVFEVTAEQIASMISDAGMDYDANLYGDDCVEQVRDQFCKMVNAVADGVFSFTIVTKY